MKVSANWVSAISAFSQEVIDSVHVIVDAQQMPDNIVFVNDEGHNINNDDASIAPPPLPDDDHRSVDPADGIYMGIHNPPATTAPINADATNNPPPEL